MNGEFSSSPTALRSDLARNGVGAFLRARGLQDPDGRTLHQYTTTDAELDDLRWYLVTHSGFKWRERDSGALVLLLAEWGRRFARTAKCFNEDALKHLAIQISGADLTKHLDRGLLYWKRRKTQPQGFEWNARVLLEGGLPWHFSRKGLSVLVAEIAEGLSWFVLADSSGQPALAKFLDSKVSRFPDLLSLFDDRYFWHEFFLEFAQYYRALAKHAQLPSVGESYDAWVARIRPLAQPVHHLPLLTNDENVFVDILFSQLTKFPPSAWLNCAKPSVSRLTDVRAIPRQPQVASPPAVAGVLSAVLRRGRLGQPLYAYRVTDVEFVALRDEVRADVRAGRRGGSVAARFCLFASEQLCRHYAGGAWTWDLVLEPIGWDPPIAERTAAVRDGLGYWQRRVLATEHHHHHLMTLVCEGGLPLNLLAGDRETHFKQFFRAVIQNAERFRSPARQFVEEQLPLLPRIFRDKNVAELSAQLADAVVALRARLPAALQVDALTYLQQIDPTWQSGVPLRLEARTAEEFLRGLLSQPNERREIESPMEVVTVLHRVAPARIERRGTCADACSVEALARLLSLSPEILANHTRIVLSLVTVKGERHQFAVARLKVDNSGFNLERLHSSPVRHEAGVAGHLLLSATVGEREIGRGELPGGSALLTNVPWVFEGGDREMSRLLAQGGLRSGAASLLVLPPPNARCESATANDAVATILGRSVIQVDGAATWRLADDAWTVAPATHSRPSAHFAFAGALARSGFAGTEYWSGFPRLEVIADGSCSRVSADKLEARVVGTQPWKRWGEAVGDLEVRVREEGETIFRDQITVLPAETKFSINVRETTVTVSAPGLVQAHLGDGSSYAAAAVQGACVLRVPTHARDAALQLYLQFATGRCQIAVPSPVRLTQFVGREGPMSGPIVLDRIPQVRAIAISPNLQESFSLEARVQGRVGWIPFAAIPRLDETSNVWELSLETVREQLNDLFAVVETMDAEVELRLVSPRSSHHPAMRVRRYEGVPTVSWADETEAVVGLQEGDAERIGSMGLELMRLQLRPLAEPDQAPRDLPRVEGAAAQWRLNSSDTAGHPSWLLTGSIRDRVRLRPLLISSRSLDASVAASGSLGETMRQTNTALRIDQLERLVSNLARAWDRPEWEELPKFFETLGQLPASTFDVLRVLARDHDTAASCLVRCGGSPEALGQIWRGMEELPLLWAFVPLESWCSAARQLERWSLSSTGGDADLSTRLIRLFTQPFLKASETISPLLSVLHNVFSIVVPSVGATPNPYIGMDRNYVGRYLRSRAQEMLARHSDEWWPTNLEPIRTTADVELGDDSIVEDLDGLGTGHRQPFLRLPYLIGIAAGSDQHLSHQSILTARRLRTFDPVWFNEAHAIGFSIAAGAQLRRRYS